MEKLIRPLNIDNFIVTSGYWDKRGTQFHQASDYAVGIGTPLYASNSGFLTNASNSKCGIGGIIVGNDNSPYTTSFCHLQQFDPKVEMDLNNTGVSMVKRGQIVGYTGNSGHSTGPHLHFKVRDKNTGLTIDPEAINYKKNYRYEGFNWWSVLLGTFTIYALVHAYKDEKRKTTK